MPSTQNTPLPKKGFSLSFGKAKISFADGASSTAVVAIAVVGWLGNDAWGKFQLVEDERQAVIEKAAGDIEEIKAAMPGLLESVAEVEGQALLNLQGISDLEDEVAVVRACAVNRRSEACRKLRNRGG